HRQAKWIGDALSDRSRRSVAVQRHAAGDQLVAQSSKHEVGIGVGRLASAAAIGGGAGTGPGRLWPVAKAAGVVQPGQGSAAGADGEHLDAGQADRIAILYE